MSAPIYDFSVRMPARFVADRVFLDVRFTGGDIATLYTDTGGSVILARPVADRLGVPQVPAPEFDDALGLGSGIARMPPFEPTQRIPQVECDILVATKVPEWVADGLLGARWFCGHIWTWNYPQRTLWLEADGWRAPSQARLVPILFKKDRDGTLNSGFPSFTVEIDGENVPMLFDTGATTELTPGAHREIGDDGPTTRAASFVVASLFNRWRKAHPGWKVIEHGEATTHSPMILVPNVRIAGFDVGPVWFTHRSDHSFHDWMSQWMGERIEGAMGGNSFHHLIITVDYPGSRAYFQCPGATYPPGGQ
jgi:hypothetical protein